MPLCSDVGANETDKIHRQSPTVWQRRNGGINLSHAVTYQYTNQRV